MKTKNSNLEYIAFNIDSVFSLVAIIAIIVRSEVTIIAIIVRSEVAIIVIIVRSLKFLCLQYTMLVDLIESGAIGDRHRYGGVDNSVYSNEVVNY